MKKKKLSDVRIKRFKALFIALVMVMFSGQMAVAQDCVLAAIASPDELWPPNHKMVSVSISMTETECVPSKTECSDEAQCGIEIDDCGNPIECEEMCGIGLECVDNMCGEPDNCDPDVNQTCNITSVTSNEPRNGTGDGNTNVDYEITGTHTVDLRAERAGTGSGRIYTITVECNDDAENTRTRTVEVKVAHSREYTVEVEDYNLAVFDFSGTVYNGVTLIQDAKGKVTGSGTFDYSSGETNLSIPVEIKGKVKGKNNIVSLKYKVQGKDADGNKLKDKVSLELDESSSFLVGTVKRKICAKGMGCDSTTEGVSLDVSDEMTGQAVLSIDVESGKNGKKLEGTGELILSDNDKYPLYVNGKYNSKKDETEFTLKGVDASTKAIKLKLKIDEGSGAATDIKAKALGQNLKYK